MPIRPTLFERMAAAARGKPSRRPVHTVEAEVAMYARVGGPPDWWHQCEVIDLDTGERITKVVEVNATEGWLIRCKENEAGLMYLDGDEVAQERIEGRFEIRRTPLARTQ